VKPPVPPAGLTPIGIPPSRAGSGGREMARLARGCAGHERDRVGGLRRGGSDGPRSPACRLRAAMLPGTSILGPGRPDLMGPAISDFVPPPCSGRTLDMDPAAALLWDPHTGAISPPRTRFARARVPAVFSPALWNAVRRI
jgi:hypothetical protein